MRTIARFVLPARGKDVRSILSEARDVSRTTYRKELRLNREDVWVDFRIAQDLWEAGLPETVMLVIAVREPQEFERRPFRRIWHVDVYKPSAPEEVLARAREDLGLCDEWLRRVTKMLTPPEQKGSEVIARLKELLREVEEDA